MRSGTSYGAETAYSYENFNGESYALGAPLRIETVNKENGSEQSRSETNYWYQWWDGAVQSVVQHRPKISEGTINTSTYDYDVIGGEARVSEVDIVDGRPRTVTFSNDVNGLVVRRDERDNLFWNPGTGDPHEIWYRFNGRQMGYVGNNGSPDSDYSKGEDKFEQSYVSSIGNRTAQSGTGAFRNGSTTSVSYADFDQSIAPITSNSQGSSFGAYSVRTGDTLASIAAALWSDSSLWYKLAEANGLSGASTLIEGQMLVIPTGVVKSTHNASTFTPYDHNG